jgi:hypothetical protein
VHVERTEVELLRGLDAVDQRHHAIAADAPDVEAVQACARQVGVDVDAGLELDQIGGVLNQTAIDRLGVDHGDGARRVLQRFRVERGADRHRIEKAAELFGVILFRRGGLRVRGRGGLGLLPLGRHH